MKKLLIIIFCISVFTLSKAEAHKLSQDHYHQLSCKGINNESDAIFSISNKAIFYNKQLGFKRKRTTKKNVFKGEIINEGTNRSKWEIVIDTRRGEAQMITTNYYRNLADDVFVRNWNNCR